MKLIELYDKPLEWDDYDRNKEYHDEFGDGEYRAQEREHNDYGTNKKFKTRNGKIVKVNIIEDHPNIYDVEFTVDGQLELTGRKEAIEIFSTVLAIMKEFMDKHPGIGVTFSAYGESRIKLYDRMVDKFLPQNYSVNVKHDTPVGTVFTMTKNNVSETKLTELFDKPMEYTANDNHTRVKFVTESGQMVVVIFAKNREDGSYEVVFSTITETDDLPAIGITGRGEQLVIFSTIIKIVKEFMNKYPNVVLKFSADEANRGKLYNTILKKFLQAPYKYETEVDKYGETYFSVTK